MSETTRPTRPLKLSKARQQRHPDTDQLLDQIATIPPFMVVGFSAPKGTIRVNLAPLHEDPRATAAGLFGINAPRSWIAVGVRVTGTARQLDTHDSVGTAESAVVVTRKGEIGSYLEIDGERAVDPSIPHQSGANISQAPQGAMVDALHRVLGLSSPGEPVDSPTIALAIWLDDIVQFTLENGSVTWDQAARIHPLAGTNSVVAPSVEMIVEATCRAHNLINWDRMHRRAIMQEGHYASLSTSEIRWMDPTMYSRWVLGSLPDPTQVIELVAQLGGDATAGILVQAIEEIAVRCAAPPIEDSFTQSA